MRLRALRSLNETKTKKLTMIILMLKVFTFLSPGWESSNKSSAVVQAVTAVSQVCVMWSIDDRDNMKLRVSALNHMVIS